jgi:hypothetical protein
MSQAGHLEIDGFLADRWDGPRLHPFNIGSHSHPDQISTTLLPIPPLSCGLALGKMILKVYCTRAGQGEVHVMAVPLS